MPPMRTFTLNPPTCLKPLHTLALVVAFFSIWQAAPALAVGSDYQAGVESEYTDNLFHESDQRLDQFDSRTGPGERFENMESESDLVTRVSAGATWRWKLRSKRRFSLGVKGAYFFHLENDIADYSRFGLNLSYSPTKRDRIYLRLDGIPDRFKKNYRFTIGALDTFDAAYYSQSNITLGYERDLKKNWSLGVDYRARERRYDDPFGDRDYDGDYLTLFTGYRLGRDVRGVTELMVGATDSNLGLDDGVIIDRSYDVVQLIQEFHFSLPARTRLTLRAAYREKDYTTDVTADGGRHNREDQRLQLRLQLRKKIGKNKILTFTTEWLDSDSDREDPTVETDEVGYEEFIAGVRFTYRF